jgi:hypothetical protein
MVMFVRKSLLKAFLSLTYYTVLFQYVRIFRQISSLLSDVAACMLLYMVLMQFYTSSSLNYIYKYICICTFN